MVFPSTPGVSVRVLRPMFVPGCGGPHEFVNSVSFSHFLSAVIPLSPLVLFLIYHFLLSLCPYFHFFLSPSSASPLSPFSIPFSLFSILLLPSPSPCSPPCLEGPMGALWFVCWKAYQHRRRHHWNLSFLSLRPLPCSLLFSPLPSPLSLSLFSSPLFNVEVLSNCWLLLWLGGNGIFRRMPHAVALTHSWVPPNHTHKPRDTNKGAYQQQI